MTTEAVADWCATDGQVSMCGTRMVEHSRTPEGVKWCFHCRTRHEFWWVVSVPDGLSYYGPTAGMEGIKPDCSDLFPGWYREIGEDGVTTDGPYCARCHIHRVPGPGQECPVCLDEKGRP